MRWDRKDLWAYGIYLLLTLVFFFRFLDGAESLGFKDLSRYFYPLRYLMVEQVRAGIWPLWNPYIFCGMPLLATLQIGFFYPLTILHYILPFDLAFNYFTILHYFLAACFTYQLLRHFKHSYSGSFLAGLIFAFSGYLVSMSSMNTSLASVIWLPLVILWWDRLLGIMGMKREERGGEGNPKKIPTSPYFSLLSLIILLSLMLLGGEPTIIYVTGWVLLFYALIFYKDRFKNIAVLALTFLVVTLLVSAQLFPFLELLQQSDRAQLASFEFISMRSFPPREVMNFLLPFFYGNQLRAGSYSEILLGENLQDWLPSPYLGFFALFFASWAVVVKPDRRKLFFAGAAGVSLILAFGKYTPLFFLLYKVIPGVSLIRYPVKYLFLASFSLAYLAGAGFEELLKRVAEGKISKLLLSLIALLSILGVVNIILQFFREPLFAWLRGLYPKGLPGFFVEELRLIFDFNLGSLLNLWGFILASALLLFLSARKMISQRIILICFVLLIFTDLAAVNIPLCRPVSPEVYHQVTPNMEIMLKSQGLFRHFISIRVETLNRCLYGTDFDQAMLDNKDKLAANRLIPHHLYDLSGYESIVFMPSHEFIQGFREKIDYGLLSRANVKYLAFNKPAANPRLKLLKHTRYFYDELYFYRNDLYRPRAYIEGKGTARITKYGPLEVLVEAELKNAGTLRLSDTYYPGWKAYVDGKETGILKADRIFRAVSLDPGKHLVRFVYDPLSFKLGLWVSGSTMLGLFIFGWWTLRPSSKPKADAGP
jgi:hypothetical protein